MNIFDRIAGNKDGKPITADTEESIKKEEIAKKEAREKRIQGKIIRVDPRGFGFITSNDIPFERIFWHWTSLSFDTLRFPDIRRGMKVEFVPRHQGKDENNKDKGWKAIRIEVVDETIDLTDIEDETE
jgi:cold shock CspA family protein